MLVRMEFCLLLCAAALHAAGCESGKAPGRAASADAAAADTVQQFWAWFSSEAARLRSGGTGDAMPAINDQLESAGLKVMAEVEKGDPWRLVITADGDPSLFPEVERVVARAPSTDGWAVVAFRQRFDLAHKSISMDGRSLAIDDVRVVATRSGDKLDLRMYLPKYAPDDDTLLRMGFVALDNAVGEKGMETRIGVIDLFAVEDAPPDALPLTELPSLLDRTFTPPR